MSKFVLSGIVALGALLAAAPAIAADVVVNLTGVRAANGPLYVSLQERDEFMQAEGSYGEIIRSPAAGSLSVTLDGVPPGEYAVSVWHDIDGDGVFDATAEGLPLDGWAMLNGASLRGAPTFDQVSFKLGASDLTLDIEMTYAD